MEFKLLIIKFEGLTEVLHVFRYLQNVNIDNFEDFGDEVYPTFDSPLRESDENVRKLDNKRAHDARSIFLF